MNDTTHTPTPWKYTQESIDKAWSIVTDARGNIVANVNSETGPDIPPLVSTKMPRIANAAHIVRCVNSHEAMVQALKMARRKIELWPEGSNPEYFPEIKAIDAAIAAAEAP